MNALNSIEEVKAAAAVGMYIAACDFLDGTMDVLLWATEEDAVCAGEIDAIGCWTIEACNIRNGVVDAKTFG